MLPKHSAVFNKPAVSQYKDAIRAMNEGQFDKLYIDKKTLLKTAKQAEQNKETGFAENIANSILMNFKTDDLQAEMYNLNRKENDTHVLLWKILKELQKNN